MAAHRVSTLVPVKDIVFPAEDTTSKQVLSHCVHPAGVFWASNVSVVVPVALAAGGAAQQHRNQQQDEPGHR